MDLKPLAYLGLAILLLAVLVFLIKIFGIFFTVLLFIVFAFLGVFFLLAFTTGFKRSGRIFGGLFCLVGKPSSGKSYTATAIALERMKEGRTVFSNYSIASVDGKYCSNVIEGITSTGQTIEKMRDLMRQNLSRYVLIIDEAHFFWWSRDFKRFTQEDKNFFTFLAQHEIEVYYIVQHENRMDTIANDCATLFGVVTKVAVPYLDMPLRFTITWWSDEELIRRSIVDPSIIPFEVETFWFNKDVANAYDTRNFGHDERPRYQGISWKQFYKQYRGKEWHPPQDVSYITFIRGKLSQNPVLDSLKEKVLVISCYREIRQKLEFCIEWIKMKIGDIPYLGKLYKP